MQVRPDFLHDCRRGRKHHRADRAVAVFLADRLRTTTGSLETSELQLDEGTEDTDELATHLMATVSMAGLRLSEMQGATGVRPRDATDAAIAGMEKRSPYENGEPTLASWNEVAGWLRRPEGLRGAA